METFPASTHPHTAPGTSFVNGGCTTVTPIQETAGPPGESHGEPRQSACRPGAKATLLPDAHRVPPLPSAGGSEHCGDDVNNGAVTPPHQHAEPADMQAAHFAAAGEVETSQPPLGINALPSKVNLAPVALPLPSYIPFPGAAPSPGGMLTFFGTHRVIMRRHLASNPTSHPLPDSAVRSGSTSTQSLTPAVGWQKVTSHLNLLRANLEVLALLG
jgi:hypothetical protein